MLYYDDISIDLESVSTRPDGAIVSIGAVCFDRRTGELGPTFHVVCDWKADAKGHVHQGTLEWWRNQEPNDVVFSNDIEREPLHKALSMLQKFADAWACPMTFWWQRGNMDQQWLDNAFERCGMDTPWNFSQWMDQRTLCRELQRDEVVFIGNKHDALDDARHQAQCILLALKTVNRKGK